MPTKKYRLINNIGGWFVFAIALLTYWLTLEPTASYWDCGEFILQANKLEVGHPPGNPIFMLAGRFFVNFAPDTASIPLMVNAMSGLLSALTILLLFWTISHLVRRLVVKDSERGEISVQQMLVIMGSALVGSLAYCWSDTFWFSAVEGEVYAFSSFCTALVFWLILKWENRADLPGSDRWLVLIAYIIGVSVAVHLLNLLCIPAIVLVFAYRKWGEKMNLVRSLLALLVSFVIVVLVLYGLVPGFIKVAQWIELLFVNGFGFGFNTGALFYVMLTLAALVWSLVALYRQKNANTIRLSFLTAVALSGICFIGSGWKIGVLLLILLAAVLWVYFNPGVALGGRWGRGDHRLPVRVMNVIMWSITVIFVGYSSYALILIRSNANTPMNQNAPDNVFDLAAYLNREQYGENPLLYGETLYSSPQKRYMGSYTDSVTQGGETFRWSTPQYGSAIVTAGKPMYTKGVPGAMPVSEYGLLTESDIREAKSLMERSQRDGSPYYQLRDYKPEVKMNPELNMLFPRLYSRQHAAAYGEWVTLDTMPDQLKSISAIDEETGDKVPELDLSQGPQVNESGMVYFPEKRVFKPSFSQNLAYFFNYQLNHMYMRYFMWNFAGRQNDLLNQHGEMDAGNWISGIPAIDNPRLGDQSLLPDDLGKDNPGHNKYYLMPLLLGIIGLLWQSFAGRRGIEQFWVVFFLFFMTGIAIVLYLNQTPGQPRERDYAFAGSFYAYAIWIGMGVAGLWRIFMWALAKAGKGKEQPAESAAAAAPQIEPEQSAAMTEEPQSIWRRSRLCAAAALLISLIVPLQMVSQTWDDHDRSGRYAARDYARNYLESLEPNAIIFCNGDNDTFPLWYAQEVEGIRPDVRIINLSYLNSDWYANQQRLQAYDAPAVKMTAQPANYAYGLADVTLLGDEAASADLLSSLKSLYSGALKMEGTTYNKLTSGTLTIPVNRQQVLARGLVAPADSALIPEQIVVDLSSSDAYRRKGYISLGELLMLDIIATNAANGWERPIYWATTVGDEYHTGLTPYLRSTGMALQLTPVPGGNKLPRTDRALGVVSKYKWGGADNASMTPYFDETARRMLYSTRASMTDVASQLEYEGNQLQEKGDKAAAMQKYREALKLTDLMMSKLPSKVSPLDISLGLSVGELYCTLGSKLGDPKVTQRGRDILLGLMKRSSQYMRYNAHINSRFLSPALTYETHLAPYQYWRIIDLYLSNGGQRKQVEDILRPLGVTIEQLKQNYDHAYGSGGGSDQAPTTDLAAEDYSAAEVAEDIFAVAGIVNQLAAMTPQQYAATDAEQRTYDSVLWHLVELYHQQGGKDSDLEANEAWRTLDKARSQRIYKEFTANNPGVLR